MLHYLRKTPETIWSDWANLKSHFTFILAFWHIFFLWCKCCTFTSQLGICGEAIFAAEFSLLIPAAWRSSVLFVSRVVNYYFGDIYQAKQFSYRRRRSRSRSRSSSRSRSRSNSRNRSPSGSRSPHRSRSNNSFKRTNHVWPVSVVKSHFESLILLSTLKCSVERGTTEFGLNILRL